MAEDDEVEARRKLDAEVRRRVEAVRQVRVSTPDLDAAMELIDQARTERRQDGTAFCSLIYGETGCGKTRLLDHYVAAQPTPEPGTMPVLVAAAPSPCTPETWWATLLAAMREPVFHNQKLALLRQRAMLALDRNKVELILVKEASQITDRKEVGAKVPYYVLDNIKMYVLDGQRPTEDHRNPIPVVMSGLEVAKRIFEINGQLLTRRLPPVHLRPFDRGDGRSWDEFGVLLALYELASAFPRAYLSDPMEDALARRVLEATDGNFQKISNLVCDATGIAIRRGADGFSKEVLALAWARQFGESDPGKNPFLNAVAPAGKKPDDSRETKLHKKGNRKAA